MNTPPRTPHPPETLGGEWAFLAPCLTPGTTRGVAGGSAAGRTGSVPHVHCTNRYLDALGCSPVDAPNAVVGVQTPEGERDVLVVELFNPVYTRTFGDAAEEWLTYEARVLHAYEGEGLEAWEPQADDDQLPQEFTNVSLFD